MSESDQLQSGYTGSVDVAFKGDIAILTMNLGENRFNKHFIRSVQQALDIVLSNSDAKAVITTGKGKYYSNGMDLNWIMHIMQQDPNNFQELLDDIVALVRRIVTFPLPTICAMNGHTYAMGAVFSLAHDYRIMGTERGWWSLNEVHINLRFDPWLLKLIRSKLGNGYPFHEAVVLGRKYAAAEAKAMGIIQETSPPADLIQNAMAWAKAIVPKGGYDRNHLEIMKTDVSEHIFKSTEMRNNRVPSAKL